MVNVDWTVRGETAAHTCAVYLTLTLGLAVVCAEHGNVVTLGAKA